MHLNNTYNSHQLFIFIPKKKKKKGLEKVVTQLCLKLDNNQIFYHFINKVYHSLYECIEEMILGKDENTNNPAQRLHCDYTQS